MDLAQTKQNEDKMIMFIKALERANGDVSKAVALSGVKRKTAFLLRQSNENFRRAWDAIQDANVQRVENKLLEKALDGDFPSIQFYLKNMRPDKWKDRHELSIEHLFDQINSAGSIEDLDRIIKDLEEGKDFETIE